MSDVPSPELSNAANPSGGEDGLHPVDRAFLAQKFAGGPLIFGVIALASSVLILGMIPGALGLRAGIDLWQRGVRRSVVVAGIVASFAGVVASIMAALLWGALLAGVLLGRDAMRETERWRGEVVQPFVLTATESISGEVFQFAVPPADAMVERVAIVLAGVGEQPSAEAITTAVQVAQRHPSCRLLIVTPLASRDEGKAFATVASAATAIAVAGRDATLPSLALVAKKNSIDSSPAKLPVPPRSARNCCANRQVDLRPRTPQAITTRPWRAFLVSSAQVFRASLRVMQDRSSESMSRPPRLHTERSARSGLRWWCAVK